MSERAGEQASGKTANKLEVNTRHVVFQINDHVEMLLHKPKIKDLPYIFLVGGFAESSRLQKSMRDAFGDRLTILVSDYINSACGYHPVQVSRLVSLDYSPTLWSVSAD